MIPPTDPPPAPPPPAPPPPPPPAPPAPPPLDLVEGGPPGEQPLAEAGTRILARFIDTVILVMIGVGIGELLGGSSAVTGTGEGDDVGMFVVASALGLIVGFVWDPLLTATRGGTPMKLVFGMRVVRATDGSPVGWRAAIVRWLVPGVFGIVPYVGPLAAVAVLIVSVVFLFTKPLRQAVWDLIAKTIVVTTR